MVKLSPSLFLIIFAIVIFIGVTIGQETESETTTISESSRRQGSKQRGVRKSSQHSRRNRSKQKTIKRRKSTTTASPTSEENLIITSTILTSIESGGVTTEDEDDTGESFSEEVLTTDTSKKLGRKTNSESTTTTQRPRKFSRSSDNNETPIPSPTDSPSSISFSSCGICKQDECSAHPFSCPTGLVLDRCGCCHICGNGEGTRCFNDTLNLPYDENIGICGPGMICILRNDLDPTDTPEALCECRDKRMVCGSDNISYQSECKLREIAHSKPNLVVQQWKPCVSAPWIPTPVENMTVAEKLDVSLSCEVKGFPNSIIHWEFLPEDSFIPIILPGDDSSIVVVVRGGPEQVMTTSWIQIISISPKYQGSYRCIAKNSEGMTQSTAYISVYKSSNNNNYQNNENSEVTSNSPN